MPPPLGTLIHTLGHNQLGKIDIGVQTVLLSIGLGAVGLRLWSRRLQRVSLQGNDWLILGATVLMIARYAVELVLILLCGMGLHALEVDRVGGPEAFVRFTQLIYIGELLWITTVALIQLSILHFHLQISQYRSTRWLTYIMMGLCTALWIGSLLATAFICTPPRRIWLPNLDGHCGDRNMLHTGSAVSEAILNGLILLSSLPLVRYMCLPRSRKSGLVGIYALGTGIVAISAIRIKKDLFLDPGDPTYGSAKFSLLSCIVPLLGLIIACLPLHTPAYRRLLGTSTFSSSPRELHTDTNPSPYWKTPFSTSALVEDPEVPLAKIPRSSFARKLNEISGHIMITSDWEIHSARNSSRNSARMERDSIR